jgi:HK97 family phage prohead protease
MTRIEGFFEEWDETVAAGAWKRTISKPDADIISTFNHNVDNLLGRTTAGTLALEESADGLLYATEINAADPNAVGIHARVARRDVSGSSVWFRVLKDLWEEPTEDNELEVAKRTILEAELFEVGPVTFPAFSQTTSEASAAGFPRLGVSRSSLAVLDGVLSAAGVTRSRPSYANRLLADPVRAEPVIRALFARAPELREKVCELNPDHAAAAPPSVGTPQPLVARRQRHAERVLDWRSLTESK